MNKTFLGALGLVVLSAACSSTSTSTAEPDGGINPTNDGGTTPDAGDCAATGSGTLTVEVTGLPAGAAAKVSAKGAAGTKDVSGGGAIDGGAYTLEAAPVAVADPRVRSVYSATISQSSVCVKNGETTKVTVSYALVPTSNKLWVTNANQAHTLLGFASADIGTTTSATPANGSDLELPNGVAFDKDGGMWATVSSGGAVVLGHFPASAFTSGGAKTPDIAIGGAALNEGAPPATALAFDPSGNLWVSATAANKILKYDAASLRASGSPAPSVTISNVMTPKALAFDADGNLWACENGQNRLVEFKASRLAASITTAADVQLTVNGHSDPRGLAFDGSKNLWANFGNTLVRLTPADRAATNALDPAVQITLDPNALAEGLAFDESGGLWFAYSASSIARLSSTQLTTSTAPGTNASPEIVVASAGIGSAVDVAIYPAPAALPLYSRLP